MVGAEHAARTHLDTLLHLALRGPIEAGAGQEFWEVTRGNPLYVRELVLGALESGALVDRSGVWHLEGRLPATSRLLDLVEQRIGIAGMRILIPRRLEVGDRRQLMRPERCEEIGDVVLMIRLTVLTDLRH